MKLKVCGMRDPDNINELIKLAPDYMGMIFYPKSKRAVTSDKRPDIGNTELIGVFVNATVEEMLNKSALFDFDLLQLHGDESVAIVKDLSEKGLRLVKVFSVSDELPLEAMKPYEPYIEYFLFDTKTPDFGGSGKHFDWSILSSYNLDKPFFLSGGIDLGDIEKIKELNLEKLHAIDVNSRFESAPGMKDMKKITALKHTL